MDRIQSKEHKETADLFRVYKNCHKMLKDRGYVVSQQELSMDIEQFRSSYAPGRGAVVDRNNLSFLVQKENNPNDQLLVFFPDEKSVGVKSIRKYCERMVTQSIMRGIMIYKKSITPSANKILNQMYSKYQMEYFHEHELKYNVMEHTLVPKHIVLSDEEKKSLLERYRLKESQLPRIQSSDPIARYLGLKRGQVVRIDRASETAGRYITYRICL